MSLSVRSRGGPHGVSVARVRTRARRMLHALERDGADVTVLLVDDGAIHRLNREYRGVDAPTDVLAFAMHEGPYGEMNPQLLGDVVISVPTAQRQAKGHGLLDEITVLLAHGLLHLCGLDHATKKQERVMDREMRRLIEAAG